METTRDVDPDPHSFGPVDQDPHSFGSVDPDPHSEEYKMKGKAEFNQLSFRVFSSLNLKKVVGLSGFGTNLKMFFFIRLLKDGLISN